MGNIQSNPTMLVLTLLWSIFAAVALASFGYVDEGDYYTIDSGSKLVIEVSKTNGDIQSMKYDVCSRRRPHYLSQPSLLRTAS